MMLGAVAGERPLPLRDTKPVRERESSPAVPSNPNSRLGRSKRSPLAQGWDRMDAIVVGIDVSKDRLDVAVRPSGEVFLVGRDAEGLQSLIERLARLSPAIVAVEATGGFETVVAASLAAARLAVVVVNPAQVRAFAQALGRRAKTDPIDAGVIAHFAEATRPQVRALPDAETQLLADLVARRRQIVAMMVAERQRQKRLTEKRLQKSIARLLAALQKELSSLEQDIDDAVRGSPAWRATRRTCSPPCRASARPSPAPCWPSCPSSEASTVARSRRSPASPPGPASPASGKAKASSAAAEPPCAPPWSSAPWWPPATTPTSRPSATASSKPERPSSSPSWPPPGSS